MTASGTYNNITVQSGGTLTLTGATTATGAVQSRPVAARHQLPDPERRGQLRAAGRRPSCDICDPAGIAASGRHGAIQMTGTRTFSPDAATSTTAPRPRQPAPACPATVRNLTVNNAGRPDPDAKP